MGSLWSLFFPPDKQFNITLIGLDAAGKTTLLYTLKGLKDIQTIPTIGFSIENVRWNNIMFTMWDLNARGNRMGKWKPFLSTNSQGIIFVVNCADVERIDEARQELEKVLREDAVLSVPLLVFANHQDLPNAISAEVVTEKLGLHAVRQRKWFVQPSVATTGVGLQEGLAWIGGELNDIPVLEGK